MKYFKEFIGCIICISGFATSVYAANPASIDYVNSHIQNLQTQINNIKSGSTYTAGTGISIASNVITNTSPGITYTGGNGINVSGTTISATTGVAEFIRTIQAPNDFVPPGTAFTIDTQVLNTTGGNVTAAAGNGGTVFTLQTGTYVIDYEMSLSSASSIGLYTGLSAGSLVVDSNTVAGSATATTWIHGRSIQQVTGVPLVFEISSVVGVASITAAGTDAGSYMVRLTILKIA